MNSIAAALTAIFVITFMVEGFQDKMQEVDLNEKKIQLFNLDLFKITEINATFVLNFPSLYLGSWGILLYRE